MGATGGAQTTTLSSVHLPKLTDPGHVHTNNALATNKNYNHVAGSVPGPVNGAAKINSAFTGITYGSSNQVRALVVPPSYISVLTLIRK